MTSSKISLVLPAGAAVAAAALTATAAPAAAAADGGEFATVYALAHGTCLAQVQSSVQGDAYPEHALFTLSTIMFGTRQCTLPVTLTWRNLDTGQTGSITRTAYGPGHWVNDGRSSVFRPGIGRFVATVLVGASHTPEPGAVEFTVSKYTG